MKMNFKRTGAMLLACTMVGGTIPPYAGVSFGIAITANAAVTGKGTEDSPYIVTSYDELKVTVNGKDVKNLEVKLDLCNILHDLQC